MPTEKSIKSKVKGSPTLAFVYSGIQGKLEQVETELRRFTADSDNPLIQKINAYIFKKSGKRIRPALLLLSSKLVGGKTEEDIRMCALVETIHTASLLHDDIIDNADTRRGEPSVHKKWGPNISVLLGDFLYIRSLGLSLESSHREIVKILTDSSTEMIDGELFEYHMSGDLNIHEDQYLDIIDKKTASLFAASCRIGGILENASLEQQQHLADYGRNLGMAFQLIDDLLDYTGEEKALGKPVLSDLSEGRVTLPLIQFMKDYSEEGMELIGQIRQNPGAEMRAKKRMHDLIKNNGALDYAHEKASHFSGKAEKVLDHLPESPTREAMSLLAQYILTRKK
jgi:octaprenyl-diphosphate synthase